jgi:hypothetical protein
MQKQIITGTWHFKKLLYKFSLVPYGKQYCKLDTNDMTEHYNYFDLKIALHLLLRNFCRFPEKNQIHLISGWWKTAKEFAYVKVAVS